MNRHATICECEKSYEIEQVACFVGRYERFQARRGIPLAKKQRDALRGIKQLSQLTLGELVYTSTSDELASSLILQSFLDAHCESHPNFARRVPPSNFAPKIEFFKNV